MEASRFERPDFIRSDVPYYPMIAEQAVIRRSPEQKSLVGVGKTTFVLGVASNTGAQGSTRLSYTVYDQEHNQPLSEAFTVVLPSYESSVRYYGPQMNLLIDERRRVMYVVSFVTNRMWAVQDYDLAPVVVRTELFDHSHVHSPFTAPTQVRLDIPSNLLLFLYKTADTWSMVWFSAETFLQLGVSPRITIYNFSFYNTDSGDSQQLFTYDYRNEYEYDHIDRVALVLDYQTNRICLMVIQTLERSSVWLFDIPYHEDSTGIDAPRFRYLGKCRRIAYPTVDLLNDVPVLYRSFAVFLMPNDQFMLMYVRSTQESRRKETYLYYKSSISESRSLTDWDSIASLDFPRNAFVPIDTSVTLIPHGNTILIESTKYQGLVAYSIHQMLRPATWRPSTHWRFPAQTRNSIYTLVMMQMVAENQRNQSDDTNSETLMPWLPSEMIDRIAQYL